MRDRDGDRLLLPMKSGPGVYEVATYPFRPERSRGDYEDDIADYGEAVVITYRDRLPSKYR